MNIVTVFRISLWSLLPAVACFSLALFAFQAIYFFAHICTATYSL